MIVKLYHDGLSYNSVSGHAPTVLTIFNVFICLSILHQSFVTWIMDSQTNVPSFYFCIVPIVQGK